MRIHTRYRTCLVVLATLLLPVASHAQRIWEPINDGLEGAALYCFYRTSTAAILAASSQGLHRLDVASGTWRKVDTVHSGALSQFASIGSDLYATDGLRALRSTDDGRSWDSLAPARQMAVDEGIAIVLFDGDRRSSDLGATWQPTPFEGYSDITHLGGGRLVAHHMGSGATLFISSDTGRTWTPTSAPGAIYSIERIAGSTIVASTSSGLHRSLDGGATWEMMGEVPAGRVRQIAPGELLLGRTYDVPNGPLGLFHSTDTGRTWRRLLEGPVHAVGGWPDGDLWFSSQRKVLRSTDRGMTWMRSEKGLAEMSFRLRYDSSTTLYAWEQPESPGQASLPTPGEVFRTTNDGGSWERILDSVVALVARPELPVIVAVRSNEFVENGSRFETRSTHVSSDHGASWTALDGGATSVATNRQGLVAVAIAANETGAPNLFITTDRGASWSSRKLDVQFMTALAVSPGGRFIASTRTFDAVEGAYRQQTVRSDDSGRSWSTLQEDELLQVVALTDDVLIGLRVLGSGDQRAFRSTDGGTTWSELPMRGGMFALWSIGNEAVVSHFENNVVTISRSTDLGVSWTDETHDDLSALYASTPTRTGELLAVAGRSILRSPDLGRTWEAIDVFDSLIELRDVASNGRVTIVSTEQRGIYRTSALSTVRLASTHDPGTDRLSVAPVPASDRIVVAFDEPVTGTFRILDARGTVAYERHVGQSVRSISVDVSGLAPGVHLLQLRSAAQVRTGRIVVAR